MTLRVVLVLVAMAFSFFGLCGCHQQIGWLWILAGPAQSNGTSSRFFFSSFLGYSRLFQCCSMIYIQVLVGFRCLGLVC